MPLTVKQPLKLFAAARAEGGQTGRGERERPLYKKNKKKT